jgi:hypothetical protein
VFFLGAASNAYAYLETYTEGETQVTAGDQNTNMYRLNAVGSIAMKKLKKIDEALARNPNENVNAMDISQIEQLIDSNENEQKQQLEQMMKKVSKTLSSPENLRVMPDKRLYKELSTLSIRETRDTAVAVELLKQLGRR